MWGYDFATAPNDPHTVYVADGAFSAGAIYRSTDAGATWSTYLTGYVVRAWQWTHQPGRCLLLVDLGTPVYHASTQRTQVVPASEGVSGGAPSLSRSRAVRASADGGDNGGLRAGVPPTDSCISSGSKIVLSWTNSTYVLQAAPTSPAIHQRPRATSPYTNSLSSPRQFYRLAK